MTKIYFSDRFALHPQLLKIPQSHKGKQDILLLTFIISFNKLINVFPRVL